MHAAPDSERDGGPASADVLLDPARVGAVERLLSALDDTTGIDRIVRLAALLLHAPVAQVSLVSQEQVIAGTAGSSASLDSPGQAEGSLSTATLRTGTPLVVADAASDERVARLPPVASGTVGGYLGVPLIDSDGHRLGALCVRTPEPRTWSPHDVGVLVELAGSAVAELELRAISQDARRSVARLGLALEAAAIGSFDLDLATQRLHWDDRLIRLFGYDASTFVPHLESFNARVHTDDAARVNDAIEAAIGGADLSTEYRIVRPGGEVRWVAARGRLLRDRRGPGRLLGVAYDSTEVRNGRDRLARVLETMTDAFYSLDRDWRFTYVNRQAEVLLERRRDELLGQVLWERFPEVVGSAFEQRYRAAAESGEAITFDAPFTPLGSWYELTASPGPDGLSVYFREITERRRDEQEREQAIVERERAYASAEQANTRLALLADASTRLAASLEPQQVLERLGELVVPDLGQWVVVALVAETAATLLGRDSPLDASRVVVVHVGHASPQERDALAAAVGALPLSTSDPVGVGAVVRTGVPEWLPQIPPGALEELAPDEQTLAALRAVGTSAAITLPFVNRGRVLGAVTVAEPAGGPIDRALLADLAGRAAVALDNALLYGAERRTGITLQRSLLPRDVPALPGVLTAVRYLPGATGAFVGGDWYQGVQVGDGLVLAMGDVMGHGMRSAARMGQLRAIVATLALEGHPPARLLNRLAQHVDVLLDLELATLLVVAYDPAGGTLTAASAGHPPPLLAPLDGPPEFLDVDPGPPLGVSSVEHSEVSFRLGAGDTLVLYSDGLVENRGESLDAGLSRLRAALQDVRLPPEAVCDHVLRVLGRSDGGDDDIALLVMSHLPHDDRP